MDPQTRNSRERTERPTGSTRSPRTGIAVLSLYGLLISSCSLFSPETKVPATIRFYDTIPPECSKTRGIKQNEVRRVTSEQELRSHYGITFHVYFNDRKSPDLYGSLYYQDRTENKYCMALPDGRFAVFHDRMIDEHKHNVVHEVCYPIQECR